MLTAPQERTYIGQMPELCPVGRQGPRIPLLAHNLIGRSKTCTLRLDDPRVSAVHAQLQWTPRGWELRDLGSRNGTWLDGRRLEAGRGALVSRGSVLSFGSEGQSWRLLGDRRPRICARPVDGGAPVSSRGEILALPAPDDPRLSVFRRPDGTWVAEGGGLSRPVSDGDAIAVGGQLWTLSLPIPLEGTADDHALLPAVDRIGMEIAHSLDEEHVVITLLLRDRDLELKPRAHNYLLLTLARARLRDSRREDLGEAERGWIFTSELARMLGCTENNINVDVYRARRQLEDAGILGAAGLIQRRQDTQQIRIGISRLRVRRL